MDIIIMPAYEPDEKMVDQVYELERKGYCIVVVDDGSGEAYQPVFDKIKENVSVLVHDINRGKGRAIKTALAFIVKNIPDADCIAIVDADGQHATEDVERILSEAKKHRDSLILGVRDFQGELPAASRFGNLLTKKIFELSSGIRISDTQTGLRAFSIKNACTFLEVCGERYEYEMNMLYTCARRKILIQEIPIRTIYHDRKNSCSHFRKIKDSVRIYSQIIKFCLSSMSGFCVDYVLFCLFCALWGGSESGIMAANILARFFSANFNYYINSRYVFEKEGGKYQGLLSYYILAAAILAGNNILLHLYMSFVPLPEIAKLLTELTLFAVSFAVQNLFIFRKSKKSEMKTERGTV